MMVFDSQVFLVVFSGLVVAMLVPLYLCERYARRQAGRYAAARLAAQGCIVMWREDFPEMIRYLDRTFKRYSLTTTPAEDPDLVRASDLHVDDEVTEEA